MNKSFRSNYRLYVNGINISNHCNPTVIVGYNPNNKLGNRESGDLLKENVIITSHSKVVINSEKLRHYSVYSLYSLTRYILIFMKIMY